MFGNKPCNFCGKESTKKCSCKYRCPHPTHPRDKNGNPSLRHLCQGCWQICSDPDRVWDDVSKCFVVRKNDSVATCGSKQPDDADAQTTQIVWNIFDELKTQENEQMIWDCLDEAIRQENEQMIWDFLDEAIHQQGESYKKIDE